MALEQVIGLSTMLSAAADGNIAEDRTFASGLLLRTLLYYRICLHNASFSHKFPLMFGDEHI